MKIRICRLKADFEKICTVFKAHPCIQVIGTEGTPPEKYTFQYQLQGLVPQKDGAFAVGTLHRAEVFLPLDYPRRPPFCRMITPVFHPNIDPQKICIGDHWSASQSIAELVVRIGEMICYQSYNTKSPLNAKAAAWVEENLPRLPLQKIDLTVGL